MSVLARPADQILGDKKDAIMAALPFAQDSARNRFMQIAMALCNDPAIAECVPASVVKCLFGCARLGLVPDPVLGHVYIIPFKSGGQKIATVIPGYKGFLELARRSRLVSSVHTGVVCANDEFDAYTDETGVHFKHKTWDVLGHDAPGDPVRMYCSAIVHGDPQVEIMRWDEVQKIKRNSAQFKFKGAESIWGIQEEAMARKTVLRRAAKLWPQSPELAAATTWDEQAERGDAQALPDAGESPTPFRKRTLNENPDSQPEAATTDAAGPNMDDVVY